MLGSTVRSRELGRRLRAAQEYAGYKGYELAAKLQCDQSTLSRIFAGERVPKDWEVANILGLCDSVGPDHADVISLCNPHQESALRLPIDKAWSTYLVDARDAVRLIQFESAIVPWPLQTPEYTRALLGDGAEQDDEWLTARRDALTLLRLPQVDLLVHEWSLRMPVGNDALMTEQLRHLVQMSTSPHISLRLVPIGGGEPAARQGAFALLEFKKNPSLIYLENHATGALIDDRSQVDAYEPLVAALDGAALTEQQTRDVVARIAVNLYGDTINCRYREGNACGRLRG